MPLAEVEIHSTVSSTEVVRKTPETVITDIPADDDSKGYVTLWFDDGLLSTYEIAYPELEIRGWKGTLAVISDRDIAQEKFTPEGDPVMSWNQVTDLYVHGWEISSHSRTHMRLNEVEDKFLLASEILGSRNDLYAMGYSISSFTFPYGQNGLDIGQAFIDRNYFHWRSSTEDINPIPAWRHITAYALTTDMEREDIFELVKQTEQSGGWLVFTLHGIVEEPVNSWQHTKEQFNMLIEVIENSSLEVVLPQYMFDTYGYAEGYIPQISPDYSNLFDSIEQKDFGSSVSLEIPALEIETNLEIVCSSDESESLYDFSILHEAPIWVCSDASPYLADVGEFGASIALGHRQWGITPKVFAKLDRLVEGDVMSVEAEATTIDFKVKETVVISPEDLWKTVASYHIAGVEYERSYMILITCTPYGTDWQRMLVVLERSYDE